MPPVPPNQEITPDEEGREALETELGITKEEIEPETSEIIKLRLAAAVEKTPEKKEDTPSSAEGVQARMKQTVSRFTQRAATLRDTGSLMKLMDRASKLAERGSAGAGALKDIVIGVQRQRNTRSNP